MRRIGILNHLACGIAAYTLCLGASHANAQLVPWRVFSDPNSTSACDVVNTDDAELVVLLNSDRLVLVTGEDTELANTEVTSSGDVLIDGVSFGVIEFATDAEGFRTLWWMSFTGRAVHLDGVTLVPSESDTFPLDVANVPCDACPFWDDGSICVCSRDSDCDDFDECTIDDCDPLAGCTHIPIICEADDRCATAICHPDEGCLVVDLQDECDDGDACTVDDRCVDGVCAGILAVCDDEDPCTDDACDSVLGCVIADVDCDDNNECTDDSCAGGDCILVENTDRCNDGDSCTSNDRCNGGQCRGTQISGCDGNSGGGPVIVLCGPSAGLTMMLTLSGLLATGALRRRRSK